MKWEINRQIITIGRIDLTDLLKDERYDVEWYDLSYDSERNTKWYMHYNPVAEKYKVILHIKHLLQEDFTKFFSKLLALNQYTVTFLNSFFGTFKTINCYRRDIKAIMSYSLLLNFDMI